jgi:hypothetical protein
MIIEHYGTKYPIKYVLTLEERNALYEESQRFQAMKEKEKENDAFDLSMSFILGTIHKILDLPYETIDQMSPVEAFGLFEKCVDASDIISGFDSKKTSDEG